MNDSTPATLAHQQDAIDRAAALAHEASLSSRAVMHSIRKIDDGSQSAGEAKRAAEASWNCLQMLLRAGAASPISRIPKSDGLDLASLASLCDPDAPELLALLDQAQTVAERIDLRRGRAVAEDISLSPGESRGTDIAETISEIAFRVRIEVHGPAGRE